jgi:hypothetical protein
MSKNVDNPVAGKQTFTDTTQSTDKDTGSVILEGGLGVEKNINAGGTVLGSNLSGTNTGDVTVGAVGSSPNSNGMTFAGQVLNLEPADATNPGVLTSGTQSIGGNKTFTGTVAASNLSGTNTGDVTLSTIAGTLAETKGGTNQTTYATGDILFASASNTLSKLSAGTNTHVLTLVGGVPAWQAPSGGSSAWALTTKTANYTATTSDNVIRCDATSGNFTITLYAASGNSGKFLFVNNVKDSGLITIDGNSSETIDDELTQELGPRDSVLLICNGTNWDIY